MEEMLNYIFGNMKTTENRFNAAIKATSKAITAQNRINKSVTLFAVATVINLIITDREQKVQDEKIRKLEREVEELKHPEGE